MSGFNVSEQAHRGWQAEIFKRLHALGAKSKYVGVTWAGDTGGNQYATAIFNALQSSSSFGAELSFTADEKVTIMAHSAGNLVVSNAIARGDIQPANYLMIDAAVPIESYNAGQVYSSPTIRSDMMENLMIESSWKEYADIRGENANKLLFSSDWHELFSEQDPRGQLTWENRFRAILGKSRVFNFYSAGEDVLENPGPNESFGAIIRNVNFELLDGRHVWVGVNILMGCQNPLLSLIPYKNPVDTSFPRESFCMAGWGFNEDQADLSVIGTVNDGDDSELNPLRKLSKDEAEIKYSNENNIEELRQIGFFKKFHENYSFLYAPVPGQQRLPGNSESYSELVQIMQDETIRNVLLTHAIPPESFAAGANPIKSIEDFDGGNFNMNDHQTEWPSSRRGDSNMDDKFDWHHSDIRNVALQYTNKVYQEILRIEK